MRLATNRVTAAAAHQVPAVRVVTRGLRWRICGEQKKRKLKNNNNTKATTTAAHKWHASRWLNESANKKLMADVLSVCSFEGREATLMGMRIEYKLLTTLSSLPLLLSLLLPRQHSGLLIFDASFRVSWWHRWWHAHTHVRSFTCVSTQTCMCVCIYGCASARARACVKLLTNNSRERPRWRRWQQHWSNRRRWQHGGGGGWARGSRRKIREIFSSKFPYG